MTDAINRDELLRELTKRRAEKERDRNLGSGFYKMGYMDGFDDAIKVVDSVRAADVEPVRKGTWIEEEDLWDDRYWMWSVYLECHLDAKDVAAMMALLKICRIATGKPKSDNWIDLAGYAAIGAEAEEVTQNGL